MTRFGLIKNKINMQSFVNGATGGHGLLRDGVLKELASGFSALSYGGTVSVDTEYKKIVQATLTATDSFTLDITNTIDGQTGYLKILTSTASAITVTFDTTFTNKRLGALGHEAVTTYTLPAGTGKEYLLNWVLIGTTMYWYIDGSAPQWTAFTQTLVGWGTPPSYTCRYLHDAQTKLCNFYLTCGVATSNATTLTFELPIAAANTAIQYVVCQITNNGTAASGLIATRVGGTTVDVYATVAFGAFTASGNKGIRLSMSYETI
jgi:hypothetical protein